MEPAETFGAHGQYGPGHHVQLQDVLIVLVEQLDAVAFKHPGKLRHLVKAVAQAADGG